MAGVEGFEPSHGGTKTRCLTAWLHPIGGAHHIKSCGKMQAPNEGLFCPKGIFLQSEG